MLYLIGLGLNEKGISLEGLEVLKKCSKLYLEGYTVDFPYTKETLETTIGKKIELLMRDKVENTSLVGEAKKQDITLLVYGSPLFATTHQTLIEDCIKEKVKVKIIHSASIFDAIAETGLQLYKFGKITSMPKWQKNFTPDSFLTIVKENNSIKAHSLILVDIGLEFLKAMEELKESASKHKIKLDKIIICSNMGTEKSKILYGTVENLLALDKKQNIKFPFCIIIPSEMHFMEEDSLKIFSI